MFKIKEMRLLGNLQDIFNCLLEPPLTFTDWMDAFSHLTKQLTNEPTVILLDEISWMGSKDTTFISKLKNWWDLELQRFPSLVVIFCGSVSTWIEKTS